MSRKWRPLFTERMAMANMGPIHRRLHVAFSRFHWWLCEVLWPDPAKGPSILVRAWFVVWLAYRRTWDTTPRRPAGHPGESQPWTMNPHTGRLLLESAQTIIRDSHRYDTRTVEMASYIVAAAGDLVVALRETLAVSAPSEASEGLGHPGESQP